MPWSKSTRIQRPRAWANTGVYRELVRRLPRSVGSKRRLLAMIDRRNRGMPDFEVTREEVIAFASWRGPMAAD